LSNSLAWLISGLRWRGSSAGKGRNTIRDLEPVRAMIFCARSRIMLSDGFPRLIGPVTVSGVSISRINPSTRSSTKQKDRV